MEDRYCHSGSGPANYETLAESDPLQPGSPRYWMGYIGPVAVSRDGWAVDTRTMRASPCQAFDPRCYTRTGAFSPSPIPRKLALLLDESVERRVSEILGWMEVYGISKADYYKGLAPKAGEIPCGCSPDPGDL
jgi:hypothetical protein